MPQLLVRLPSGQTRLLDAAGDARSLHQRVEDLEGLPCAAQRLVVGGQRLRPDAGLEALAGLTVQVHLPVLGGGGDQPDWTERGRVPGGSSKKRGPDSRPPDWHGDAAKYAAKVERDKRERGELLVAIGPYCVPCGKRFAKQTVYDAHLSGQKHLRALERLGRAEEAMVCRLDVEAKRRIMTEARELDDAQKGAVTALPGKSEDPAASATRKADREEKLRQRSMLPMPATVSAASVYEEAGGAAPSAAPALQPPHDSADLAAAAAGISRDYYTSGMQDLSQRTNRFTTTDKMEMHRKMAIVPANWFGTGIHSSQGGADPAASEQLTVGAAPSSDASSVFTPGLRIVDDDPTTS